MSQNNQKNNTDQSSSLPVNNGAQFLAQLKRGIWLVGIPAWLFSAADRGFAAIADRHLSLTEGVTLLAISFLFVSWLSLKPEAYQENSASKEIESSNQTEQTNQSALAVPADSYLETTKARMAELQNYHLISQSYILPYPYLAQIYHLLNLKHLETIHSFSLNNLKVVKVNALEATEQGGMVQFETVLDSPFNVLRIWRQPIVEAKLTLHNPYTVELAIPVYDDKSVNVIFSAIPLSLTEHQFYVDIYSNLSWYKPLLKLLMHFASVLTLVEDLPYLQALTQRVQRLTQSDRTIDRATSQEMMWLFGRFVSLYGSAPAQLAPAEGNVI